MNYINLKIHDQAGQSFARAIELEPENGLNYAWLAYVYEGRGQLVEAREAWKRAIQYLTEPDEVERARRRLASVERRVPRKDFEEEKARKEPASEEEGKKPAWQVPRN